MQVRARALGGAIARASGGAPGDAAGKRHLNAIEAETEANAAEIELQSAINQVSSEIEANATEIGLRSMATIDQVRAAEEKASEIEANAAIAYYAPGAGGVGAPGDA